MMIPFGVTSCIFSLTSTFFITSTLLSLNVFLGELSPLACLISPEARGFARELAKNIRLFHGLSMILPPLAPFFFRCLFGVVHNRLVSLGYVFLAKGYSLG